MAGAERLACHVSDGFVYIVVRNFRSSSANQKAVFPASNFPLSMLRRSNCWLRNCTVYLAGGEDDAMMREIDVGESREHLHSNARNVYYPRRLLSVTRFRSRRMQCRWRARASTCKFRRNSERKTPRDPGFWKRTRK